jgi:hypothetical protein
MRYQRFSACRVLSYGKNTAKMLSERGGLRWSFLPPRRHHIGLPGFFGRADRCRRTTKHS